MRAAELAVRFLLFSGIGRYSAERTAAGDGIASFQNLRSKVISDCLLNKSIDFQKLTKIRE
jgi:hypothetical protein